MFGLIKFVLFVFLFVSAFTVPLGKRTFYGHISAIWSSNETKELRSGVKQKYIEIKKNIEENDKKQKQNRHKKIQDIKHQKNSFKRKKSVLSKQRKKTI